MLARIGAAYKKTAAQICLRYLVQQNIVVIPRTSKLERLSENAAIFDFALSDEDMAEIAALAQAAAAGWWIGPIREELTGTSRYAALQIAIGKIGA